MSHSDDNYARKSFIKDIYIELPDYRFLHGPIKIEDSLEDTSSERFIGRSRIKQQLLNILKKGDNGAYLITGYRGAGKTSFVNKTINEYTQTSQKAKKTLVVSLFLNQEKLNLKNVYRQMALGLREKIGEREKRFTALTRLLHDLYKRSYIVTSILILLAIGLRYNHFHQIPVAKLLRLLVELGSAWFLCYTVYWFIAKLINARTRFYINSDLVYKRSIYFTSGIVLFLLLNGFWNLDWEIFRGKFIDQPKNITLVVIGYGIFWFLLQLIPFLLTAINPHYRFLQLLDQIIERTSAELTKEKGVQSKGMSRFPVGFINKMTKKYPIANAKELEQELIQFFRQYHEETQVEMMVVFDELDKIELGDGPQPYNEDLGATQGGYTSKELDMFRERRTLIIGILGSLKHFITSAQARFIFIAGREMFDASLADINDRQSSISSIFHQIINVESFLKDSTYQNTEGITNTIHEFLKSILLPSPENDNPIGELLLQNIYNHLTQNIAQHNPQKNQKTQEAQEIIFALQNYIIYLTYRSHGVPHKLNKIIEELIVDQDDVEQREKWKRIVVQDLNLGYSRPKKTKQPQLFLKFSPNNQYRFAFVSYLYRPFILKQSRYLRQYSDQVLFSTPYLMDHLIKFHPFAFSLRDLELLPEVLSSNRQPIIRYFTEELVAYLKQSFIRNTEISLFDYKFFKKQQNEIEYLSKIFESESAAFNFTLDENYEIKLQLRARINDLRTAYKGFPGANKKGQPLYSILYLNILLGDIHFFDQEYSVSVVAYQDALQFIRQLLAKQDELQPSKTVELYILMAKINLKLGLTFEKMNSNEMALAHYSNVTYESRLYFEGLNKQFGKALKFQSFSWASLEVNLPLSLNELLQISIQGFLAKLYLQEKFSVEGVAINKIIYTQQAFQAMIDFCDEILKKENQEIFANFYNNLGTLLFFQNASREKNLLKGVLEQEQISQQRSTTWRNQPSIQRTSNAIMTHAEELKDAQNISSWEQLEGLSISLVYSNLIDFVNTPPTVPKPSFFQELKKETCIIIQLMKQNKSFKKPSLRVFAKEYNEIEKIIRNNKTAFISFKEYILDEIFVGFQDIDKHISITYHNQLKTSTKLSNIFLTDLWKSLLKSIQNESHFRGWKGFIEDRLVGDDLLKTYKILTYSATNQEKRDLREIFCTFFKIPKDNCGVEFDRFIQWLRMQLYTKLEDYKSHQETISQLFDSLSKLIDLIAHITQHKKKSGSLYRYNTGILKRKLKRLQQNIRRLQNYRIKIKTLTQGFNKDQEKLNQLFNGLHKIQQSLLGVPQTHARFSPYA